MKRLLLLASAIWLMCAAAIAAPDDIKCSGVVVDEQGEPIIGATVTLPGTSTATATDVDGHFTLLVPQGKKLNITYIGYKPVEVVAKPDMGTIPMEVEAQMLKDVVITQSAARTRLTPVAVSTLGAQTIDVKLGNQELPEVLKTTPGVWTTRDGGGFGDAKTNMRGFKSPNVAVMVNGIPINDMEWGGVYWSNWAGLGDVAANIQTQRGLGATIVSTPSVGGTINITTRTIDVEKGGSVWYGMGNDGMNNFGVKVSTGLMKNGWAITVLASRKWGDGYIQGTPFNSYNYFVNVSKRINENHQLALTAFGAPQTHYKRDSNYGGLTIDGYQTYAKRYMGSESMYRYNPTFGYDNNGQMRNSSYNYYHKPQISLNHIWKIDETSSLSSAVYVSLANGGGYSGQGSGLDGYSYSDWRGAQYGELNMKFRRPDGTFDYGAIQDLNAASTNGSKLVMSESINSHKWFGLVSSYKKELELGRNKLNLTGGIDLRYYVGDHKNKINDLYGGEYFIDYSTRKDVDPLLNSAAANPNWKYEKLGIGDIVYRNYLGYTVQEGIYGQGEYTILDGKFNFVLSGALNNTSYWRRDKFYYDKANEKSETVNFIGGTIKGGANYNIDDFNNVFFNLGYISRAPFFSGGAFLNSTNSNAINKDAVNEKVMSYEIGYGYNSRTFAISVNAYWTKWMDRSGLSRRGEFSRADGTFYMNMTGVDARHMGIEMNFNWIPVRWLNVEGMISWGDWIWDSNANGYFYNQLGQPIQNLTDGALADGIGAENHLKSTLNQKGVKVGGSAQTTGSLSLTFLPFKGFRIGGDWVMNARNYSDFYISPSSLGTKAINVNDLWQIPWGQQLDLNASYRFKIGNVNATLYGNVYNLFNYNYIMDAQTPTTSNGTWQEAYSVFYSFGRTYTVRMRINF
ncbi:carboxypeptidase-like regulatory domain-containing protein [uncultured Muribaculum sp.]|uniref:TonB-dependent receptor n=1 Tax=uncultured Muribaculum sp. TaxID=1918613 RepID=UPI002711D292|nr:carboxypeptidase-like regulatory domain-containing protein [uncultured Muribaculum sp.]